MEERHVDIMLSAKAAPSQWGHGESVTTFDLHKKRERCETITKFEDGDEDKSSFPENMSITVEGSAVLIQHSNPEQVATITRFQHDGHTIVSATNSALIPESIPIFTQSKKRARCETITRFAEDDEDVPTGSVIDMPAYLKREMCETFSTREAFKRRDRCETITKFMGDEGVSSSVMIVHETLGSSDNLTLSKKRGRCETITKFLDEDKDTMLDASTSFSQWSYNDSVGTLDLSKNLERSENIKKLMDNDHVPGIYTSKARRERWASITNFVEEEEDIIVAATKAYCVWADHETFYTLDLSQNREECETITKFLDNGEGASSSATNIVIPTGSANDMPNPKKRKRCEIITSLADDKGPSSSATMIAHQSLANSDELVLSKKRGRCETITKLMDDDEDIILEALAAYPQGGHKESVGTLDLRKKRAKCETITKCLENDSGTSSFATNAELPTGSDNAYRPPKKREKCETVTSLTVDEGTSSFATNDAALTGSDNDMPSANEEPCKTINNTNINKGTSLFTTNEEVSPGATDISSPNSEDCETITNSPRDEGTSSFATNEEVLIESANDITTPKPEECETITTSTDNKGTSSFATNAEVLTEGANDLQKPKIEECETLTSSTENAAASVAVDLRCGASIARGHEEEVNAGVNQQGPGVAPTNNQMAPPVRCPGCPLQEPIIPPYRPRRPRRDGSVGRNEDSGEDKPVVKADPLPHGEIRERMLELRSIIERSLVTNPPPPGQRDVQCENQLRERMAELRTIFERGMEQMQDEDVANIAAPAKRQNEALIRLRSGYDGVMLYETRIFLSDKGSKKARRKKQENKESQTKILHLSENTGLTNEDLVQVTNKIQKRFMRARRNMCEFCHNQGMAKIYITVTQEGSDEEYNMQMILINAARVPSPQRMPRIPACFLN